MTSGYTPVQNPHLCNIANEYNYSSICNFFHPRYTYNNDVSCMCVDKPSLILYRPLVCMQAIALAKILNPQTQQELLSSLSEWKQVVYGDSPGNVRETIGHHSPLRTTLALQQVISEAITVSLKRNRQEDVFGRMSPSRSPGYDKIVLSGSPHAIRKLCQGNYPVSDA